MSRTAPYNQPVDCPATLTDTEVIDFCRNGYLMLPGVVPEEINRKVVDYLDSVDSSYEPTPIMEQDWFVEGVLMNPQAAGAVRSLLGANFTLPAIISNHRGVLPSPQPQNWHRDGGSIYTPKLEYLQVFYLPETCTEAMGATELLPGSHFLRSKTPLMAHYGSIAGTVSTASPAGSIFLTIYSIWHRRGRATAASNGNRTYRNLLKYNYWRTEAPCRDWIREPGIDFNQQRFDPPFPAIFEQFQGGISAAKLFCWLCGIEEEYEFRGGQCWPVVPTTRNGTNQMGIPPSLRNR